MFKRLLRWIFDHVPLPESAAVWLFNQTAGEVSVETVNRSLGARVPRYMKHK